MTLNDCVQRLAHAHDEMVRVSDEQTGMPVTLTIHRRALLDDLEDAEATSRNRGGAGASRSFLPIDSRATELKARVRGELVRDLIRLGVVRFRFGSLAQLLAAWYGEYRDSGATLAEEAQWVGQLDDWEAQVRAIVEPKTVLEVLDACPICGAASEFVEDERKTMLTIQYEREQVAASAELVCGRCGVVAWGPTAIAATLGVKRITG